ncbi:MAG: metallophosphoesterase family protein [bacterium]
MKILVVSDHEEPALHEFFDEERWKDIDFVISCGDLPPEFLSFLVTVMRGPLFYVRGNHDIIYSQRPPEGCTSIEGKVVIYRGLRIVGFEGSMFYGGNDLQYTEREMQWKILKTLPSIWKNRSIDILVTHAPPSMCVGDSKSKCKTPVGLGEKCPENKLVTCNESKDITHKGFESFRKFDLKYRPKFHLHGHTHLGYTNKRKDRVKTLGDTKVIDCYGYYVLEF